MIHALRLGDFKAFAFADTQHIPIRPLLMDVESDECGA